MLDNLYPTSQKLVDEGIWLTDEIPNLDTSLHLNFFDAYCMGYLDNSYIPEHLRLHQPSLSEGSLEMDLDLGENNNRNHAWGFVQASTDNDGLSEKTLIYTNNFGDLTAVGGTLRFINKIQMASYATSNRLTVRLRAMIVPAADLDENDTTYKVAPGDGTYTMITRSYNLPLVSYGADPQPPEVYKSFQSFLQGRVGAELDFGSYTYGNNITTDLKFSVQDFSTGDNPTCRRDLGDGYVLFAQLADFTYWDFGRYVNNQTHLTQSVGIIPFIEWTNPLGFDRWLYAGFDNVQTALRIALDYNTGNTITSYSIESGGFPEFETPYAGSYYTGNFYVQDGVMFADDGGSPYWYGGNVLNSNYPGIGRNGIMRGRHIVESKSTAENIFAIYTYLTPDDIWNAIAPYHKIDVLHDQRDQVVPNPTYTTNYSTSLYEDNVPINEREEESYANLQDKLMKWQQPLADITEDLFDINKMPDWDPDGQDTDEDSGSIYLNEPGALGVIAGFSTLYVLNSTAVNAIGQRLWGNISDPQANIKDNFWAFLGGSSEIDYSLTLSEVIQYFVSLKYFPFELDGISTECSENAIRIGTGSTPIGTGSFTPRIPNNTIAKLNGGEVKVPSKWDGYLDIEPYTTCSIYVPYCGTTQLPLSVINGATLRLTYEVDLITGAIVAVVQKIGAHAQFPIAVLNGSCGFDILMTGTNGNSQLTNMVSNLASKSIDWTSQLIGNGISGIMDYATSGGSDKGMGFLKSMIGSTMDVGAGMLQNNVAEPALLSTMPMTCGASSSLSSLILPQKAYIQIRRHNPYRLSERMKLDEINPLEGRRSYYYGKIGTQTGARPGPFKCCNVQLSPVSEAGATKPEIDLIRQILLSGCYSHGH